MTAIAALLLGTLVASPIPSEAVSMDCLVAVNRALHHISTEMRANGTVDIGDAGSDDKRSGAVEGRYERATCSPSNVVPGRVYVSLTRKGGALHRHHGYYVVEPSGEVTAQRSMPCEEHPSACR